MVMLDSYTLLSENVSLTFYSGVIGGLVFEWSIRKPYSFLPSQDMNLFRKQAYTSAGNRL